MDNEDPPGPELNFISPAPVRPRNRRGKNRRAMISRPRPADLVAATQDTDRPANSVCFTGLEPALANLGILIGIIAEASDPNGSETEAANDTAADADDGGDGGEKTYCLDPTWFEEPLKKLQDAIKQNPGEIAGLLTQLLGSAAGTAMGLPVKDPALLGTWYPLITPDAAKARGLYIVNYTKGGDQIFGLGVLGQFDVPSETPVIMLEAFGLIPILRMGEDGVAPVLTDKGFPISLGLAVEGAEEPKPPKAPPQGEGATSEADSQAAGRKPLFDLEGISFDGVKVNVLIDVAAPSVSANVVVLRLKLPDDEVPVDRSLSDLANLTSVEIQDTAAALFIGALSQISEPAAKEARYLLPVIGVSGTVPGQDKKLPDLDWGELFVEASKPNAKDRDIAAPFKTWFTALTSDPDLLGTWLASIGGAMGAAEPKATGAGTRADPKAIVIADLTKTSPAIGALSFTMASVVQQDGNRHVYPGLRFQAAPKHLLSAPKASDPVLRLNASAEIAEFVIGSGDFAFGSPTSLDFSLGVALTDANEASPLVDYKGFQVGALKLGLELSARVAPVPSMQLLGLVTPEGPHDTVDLLSPSDLANAAADVLHAQLISMLGIGGANPVPFSEGIATLVGVIAPKVEGGTWPTDLPPPFLASQIVHSIADPVTAFADYYRDVLTYKDQVNGKKAFTYIVEEIAGLLAEAQTGSVSITVTGDGTPIDPWSANIAVGDTSLPAHLTAFTAPAKQGGHDVSQLVIGIVLAPELTVGGTKIEPNVTFDLVSVDLPDKGSAAKLQGIWAPLIAAGLRLPDGFTSPEVGGAVFSIGPSEISGSWSRTSGLGLSLLVSDPVLKVDGQTIPLGQSLDLSDPSQLADLVKNEVAAFRQMIVSLLGVALLRTGTRPGLALAGSLGLLKEIDKAKTFPTGLTWPAIEPLALESFADPWPQIRTQIGRALADDATAGAVLSLVGWSLDGSLSAAPKLNGSLAADDPFCLPVLGSVFDVLVWASSPGKSVGLGLQKQIKGTFALPVTSQKIEADTRFRLNALDFDLTTGSYLFEDNTPGIEVSSRLTGADGAALIDSETLGKLGSVTLGISISSSGVGAVEVVPIVTLADVKLPGESDASTITYAQLTSDDFTPRLESAALALLNEAVNAAGQAAAGTQGFAEFYTLMADLGLTQSRPNDTGPFGLNPGGWSGLVADPEGFAKTQFAKLLSDAATRNDLFQLVETLLGIKLPTIDAPILEVLAALDILGPSDLGYPIRLDTIVSLVRNPVTELVARASALISDRASREALASKLATVTRPQTAGPFRMDVANGNTFVFSVDPATAPSLAGFVTLIGSVTLDLATPAVTAEVGGLVVPLGLGPRAVMGFHPAATGPVTPASLAATTPDFAFEIAFGDGSRPAPDPLVLFGVGGPKPPQDLADQLAEIVPVYALSMLSTFLIETQLLAKYPLAQEFFKGIGLAEQIEGEWRMPALLGVIDDPRAWLLSNGVLGEDGNFSVAGFIAWLSNLPKVTAPNGIAVGPVTGGVQVTGLPYGFDVSLTGKDEVATIALGAKEIDIAHGTGKLEDLSIGVSLGPKASPGVVGKLRIETGPGGIDPIFSDIGYDNAFTLSVGQLSAKSQGETAADPDLVFNILPFQGFGSLVEQAARQVPAKVLQEVTPKILDGLRDAGAKDFADALQTAGTDLDVSALVTAISQAEPFNLQTVETAALDWLKARLSDQNKAKSADAVVALLSPLLGDAITSEAGLVKYTPSKNLPITFDAGVSGSGNDAQLGLWAELNLPDLGRIHPRIQRSGIGIPVTGEIKPIFSFGVDVTVLFEGDTGPQLALKLTEPEAGGLPGLALSFDPVGSIATSTPSDLSRALLPDFFPQRPGEPAALGDRVEDWLLACLTQVLPRYVAAVILNQKSVATWLGDPLFGPAGGPSPSDILIATTVLTKDGARYALASFDTIKAIKPQTFAANFLKAMLSKELKVLTFGPGDKGELWIGPNPQDAEAVGVRMVAPNLQAPQLDFVTFQLGAQNTEWIQSAGGPSNVEPGIGVYLPIPDIAGEPTPEFGKIELNLNNLGLDFTGKAGTPLVDYTRFKLGGVGPRTFVNLALNDANPPDVKWGVMASLNDIAISLAPASLPAGSGGNPVAKNILGAGDNSAGGDENSAVTDPSFSVVAAYASKPYVTLVQDGKEAEEIIIPVQRSFGPLNVVDIGFGWRQPDRRLSLLFGGGISLAGLNASVDRLSVGIPVNEDIADLNKYELDLQGLAIDFRGGAVTLAGGLLKREGPPISYDGAIIVQAASFGITALGSYTLLATTPDPDGPKTPSLFVFGSLSAPLGGVPAFFITGVAAGFGVNRSIKLPDISEVQDFPLLPGGFKGDEPLNEVLAKLSGIVKPQIGQYWLAAGLSFTSFELIDGLAILFVQFGRRFEIDLIGLASAPLPKGVPKGEALAYIELALKATVIPSEGFISVQAQLTPNSYVLAKPCRLTGGFAFMLWLKDIDAPDGTPISAGQFVISLGGYHPAFKAPSYYPNIPRLGLEWLIDVSVGKVSIKGGTYFALVPSAIMAGGYLNVLFEAGPIRAWLDAAANFLIQWKPFYFNVSIAVSIGIALKITIGGVSISLSISIGADLVLEGPPTHGEAHVSLYIVSFTIPIGDNTNATTDNLLHWDAFKQAFLPAKDSTASGDDNSISPRVLGANAMAAGGAAEGDKDTARQPIKLAVASGRLGGANGQKSTDDNSAEDAPWDVRAVPFALSVSTVIPCSAITFAATKTELQGKEIGIRPMGAGKVTAPLHVTVTDPSGDPVDLDARNVALEAVIQGAPAAVWSKSKLDTKVAPDGDKVLIDGSLLGTVLRASSYVIVGDIPAFPILNLKYDEAPHDLQLPFAQPPVYGPAPAMDQTLAITRLKATIMAETVIKNRNAAFATFRSADLDAPADPSLVVMAHSADLVVQAPPVLAAPAVYQANLPKAAVTRLSIAPRVAVNAAAKSDTGAQPRLTALLRRHVTGATATRPHPALTPQGLSVSSHLQDFGATGAAFAGRESLEHALVPGHSAILEVDPAQAHHLSLTGGGALRAVCLDRHESPISDTTAAADGTKWALPGGTRQIVLQAVAAEAVNHLAGWQLDSQLLQISNHLSIGDHCILRTQNAVVTRKRGRPIDRRIVEAEDLIDANSVTGLGNALQKGWLQTVLPGTTKAFTVVTDLQPDEAAARLRVSAISSAVPGLAATTRLAPVEVFDRQGGSALSFEAPVSSSDDAVLSIVTHIGGTVDQTGRILAVHALPSPDARYASGSDMRLLANAVDVKAGSSAPISFTLSQGASPNAKELAPRAGSSARDAVEGAQ